MYWPREMSGDTYSGIGLHCFKFEGRKAVMRLVATGVGYATLAQIGAEMAPDIPLDAHEQYTGTNYKGATRSGSSSAVNG